MPPTTYDAAEYRENETRETARQRFLWLKVIAQAVADAESETRYRNEAREWLVTDDEGIRKVCMLAGVDVNKVIERHRRIYGDKRNGNL